MGDCCSTDAGNGDKFTLQQRPAPTNPSDIDWKQVVQDAEVLAKEVRNVGDNPKKDANVLSWRAIHQLSDQQPAFFNEEETIHVELLEELCDNLMTAFVSAVKGNTLAHVHLAMEIGELLHTTVYIMVVRGALHAGRAGWEAQCAELTRVMKEKSGSLPTSVVAREVKLVAFGVGAMRKEEKAYGVDIVLGMVKTVVNRRLDDELVQGVRRAVSDQVDSFLQEVKSDVFTVALHLDMWRVHLKPYSRDPSVLETIMSTLQALQNTALKPPTNWVVLSSWISLLSALIPAPDVAQKDPDMCLFTDFLLGGSPEFKGLLTYCGYGTSSHFARCCADSVSPQEPLGEINLTNAGIALHRGRIMLQTRGGWVARDGSGALLKMVDEFKKKYLGDDTWRVRNRAMWSILSIPEGTHPKIQEVIAERRAGEESPQVRLLLSNEHWTEKVKCAFLTEGESLLKEIREKLDMIDAYEKDTTERKVGKKKFIREAKEQLKYQLRAVQEFQEATKVYQDVISHIYFKVGEIQEQMSGTASKHPKPAFSPNWPSRPVKYFLSRDDTTVQLNDAFDEADVVAISGLSGCGKTTCALQYAKQKAEEGCLVRWMACDSEESLLSEYLSLASLLVPEASTSGMEPSKIMEMVNAKLTGWECLLVLDNTSEYSYAKKHIDTFPGQVLLTSPNTNLHPEVLTIHLEPFTDEMVAKFLNDNLEAERIDVSVDEICSGIGRIPKSLECAVAYLTNKDVTATIKDLLRRLDGGRLGEFNVEQRVLGFALDAVQQPEAIQLLRCAAHLEPDGIPYRLVKEVLWPGDDCAGETLTTCLAQLETLSLVAKGKTGFSIHRSVQKAVLERMSAPDREAVSSAVLEVFDRLFPETTRTPGPTWSQARSIAPSLPVWLLEEGASAPSTRVSLLSKLGSYRGNVLCQFRVSLELLKKALKLTEVLPLGTSIASLLDKVGTACLQVGNPEEALEKYEMCLKLVKDKVGKDGSEVAAALDHLGRANYAAGRHKEAVKRWEESLKIYQDLVGHEQDHPDVARLLLRVGVGRDRTGNKEESLRYCKQSLDMYRRLYPGSDHPDIAVALNNIGCSYHELGRDDEALEFTKDSLEMTCRLFPEGDHPETASRLESVGCSYEILGRYEDALRCKKQSLEMRQRLYAGINHPDVAYSLSDVASALEALGRRGEALPYKKAYLDIRRRLHGGNDHPDVAVALTDVGRSCEALGKDEEALSYKQESLDMSRRLHAQGDHQDVVLALGDVASTYEALGRHADAAKCKREEADMMRRLAPEEQPHTESMYDILGARSHHNFGRSEVQINLHTYRAWDG